MPFKTIYVDPPWEFRDKLDKSRRKPYKTLSFLDLCELPVEKISADNSHLYLWVPNALIQDGLELMYHWGFKYKTIIVWLKMTEKYNLWFGMGHYFRDCTELLLFGVRGNLRTRTRDTRNLIIARKGKFHSEKPVEAYELIERNSYAPRIELFARKKRLGWKSLGDEIDGRHIRKTILEVMKK